MTTAVVMRRVYIDAWQPTDATIERVIARGRLSRRELRRAWRLCVATAVQHAGVRDVEITVRATPKGEPRFTASRGAPAWTDTEIDAVHRAIAVVRRAWITDYTLQAMGGAVAGDLTPRRGRYRRR
jgi:hypothetical protein